MRKPKGNNFETNSALIREIGIADLNRQILAGFLCTAPNSRFDTTIRPLELTGEETLREAQIDVQAY